MSNHYNGDITIRLYHKDYPMTINMDVIAEFQSETGEDYMMLAIRALNALRKAADYEPMDQAEIMTAAVKMDHAAWLFFLAAKKKDKTVTFGEIQEAVLMEGPMRMIDIESKTTIESYPVLFAQLVMFATLGVVDTAKKPS